MLLLVAQDHLVDEPVRAAAVADVGDRSADVEQLERPRAHGLHVGEAVLAAQVRQRAALAARRR